MEVYLLISVGVILILIVMMSIASMVSQRIKAPTDKISKEVKTLQDRVDQLEAEKNKLSD